MSTPPHKSCIVAQGASLRPILIQWVIPPIPSNQATHGEYWKLKRNTRVFNIVFNSKGEMNNDPVDNIMQRSDFSLPIISFIWIAAAGPALHFIVLGGWVRGLNSIACVCQNLIYVLMTDSSFIKKDRTTHIGMFIAECNCCAFFTFVRVCVSETVGWST